MKVHDFLRKSLAGFKRKFQKNPKTAS